MNVGDKLLVQHLETFSKYTLPYYSNAITRYVKEIGKDYIVVNCKKDITGKRDTIIRNTGLDYRIVKNVTEEEANEAKEEAELISNKLNVGDTLYIAGTTWKQGLHRDGSDSTFDSLYLKKVIVKNVYPIHKGKKITGYMYYYTDKECFGDQHTYGDPMMDNAYTSYSDAKLDMDNWQTTHNGWHDTRVMTLNQLKKKLADKENLLSSFTPEQRRQFDNIRDI